MTGDRNPQALRDLRTLFTSGSLGGLTDAQLVEAFLARDGPDREDAFAALVRRHGPMVLGVCRRMLPGSADSEDAFQAVFLVLARRAESIRGLDALRPWLYGVAVRTAKEARRRSARRRAREAVAMREPQAAPAPAPDDDRADWLAILDEEIARLPAKYREPLQLCELEGLSRRDAADRLGLPEGTLSSRLARGRSMLRDRLIRRGVAPGVALMGPLIAGPSEALLAESMAESTVRLALQFVSGGTVPVAVASLAEGVLKMLASTKTMMILGGLIAMAATAALAVVIPLAAVPDRDPPLPEADPEPAVLALEKQGEEPRSDEIRGIVVDEADRPVAGVKVRINAYQGRLEAQSVSANDGSFAIPNRRLWLRGGTLLARSADGSRLGLFRYPSDPSFPIDRAPRIVLKPARSVQVRVVDASKAPIEGAAVQAAGGFAIVADASTGDDGLAQLRIPADAKVEWIFALRSGKGFDYAEFGPVDDRGQLLGGLPAPVILGAIELVLAKPRTARIKAVDREGRPMAGLEFAPWLLAKEARKSQVNVHTRIFEAATGPDGIATFDWLPSTPGLLQFFPSHEGYADRRVIVEEGDSNPVVAEMVRNGTILGRVAFDDGRPAAGIAVHAYGTGRKLDHGRAQVRTASDGSYTMNVPPDEVYSVYIEDKDWAAPSRLDVIVREGEPVEGIDFRLGKGTILRGRITVGPDDRPVAKQYIALDESGQELPNDLRVPGDSFHRQAHRQWGILTDADGRYTFRVAAGTYTIHGPPRTEYPKITVTDQEEIVRDFRMPRPEKGPIAGRVVVAGKEDVGVAGAKIEIVACSMRSAGGRVIAGDDGRFQTERALDPLVIHAQSPDGTLGAIVEVGADQAEVVITLMPTATATGLLLDEEGKVAANQKLEWGRRVFNDPERTIWSNRFAPKVATDAEGRFTLPNLVIGQEYRIAVSRENRIPMAGVVQPEAPGTIDLGTLQIGAYRPPANPEDLSSFRKDAPDAGAIAPAIEATTLDGQPLKLGDFRGKFVLLDFWATWCGPCIGEIPQLQAVHEQFGKDDRFTILSLSVDESIEEPRAFQEKRKLPWRQAFLGGGIHGPTPGLFGVRAIPAFVLVGPDGKIVARGMRGEEIRKAVARALETPR